MTSKVEGEDDCVEFREKNSKPVRYQWFKKQKLTVIEARCGYNFAIAKCKTENGDIQFYGIASDVSYDDSKRFGSSNGIKKVYGNSIALLTGFKAHLVSDFACG